MKIRFDTGFVDCVDEIQRVALEIYGKYDLDKSLLWMTEEFGELFKSIRKSEGRQVVTGEMGDLLAWIFCMGNILDLKISDALKLTMKKEIKRQFDTYKKLKYASDLEYVTAVNEKDFLSSDGGE